MARYGFYEFFAGGGMARAGLGPDWDCLFANDFDEKKADSYRVNWGGDHLHVGDVGLVNSTQLRGVADLVWASFPCQDLSLAGNGAGLNGTRSGAFWPFWRLVSELIAEGRKPKTIVLENVCGLLTSHNGADFQALCEHVAKAGYWIGAIIADARDFLPQSRPRLFLIALDTRLETPGYLLNRGPMNHWHPAQITKAYACLPETIRTNWIWLSPTIPPIANITLADVIEDEPKGVEWHPPSETRRLLAMMSPVNRAKVDLVAANRERAVGAIYKRTRIENGARIQRAEVRFDVAGCLRTPGGGSSRQIIIVSEKQNIRTRLISPRETARLMGLAEDYILPQRYNDAYHLTGDGVAVPVVRHIREAIIDPFLKTNVKMKASA